MIRYFVFFSLKADISAWNLTDLSDGRCGDPLIFHETMIGEGQLSHLGRITITMAVCNNVQTGDYYDIDVIFVAANGDEYRKEGDDIWRTDFFSTETLVLKKAKKQLVWIM